MARPIKPPPITDDQRRELRRLVNRPTAAQREVRRAWIILNRSQGLSQAATAQRLRLNRPVVNYATHKHLKVKAWLARHRRFHLHFTPTSSSWLNLVERFFRNLTVDVVREGSFGSVKELVAALEQYLVERNLAPRPYRWKAQGQAILAKLHRARQAAALSSSE